MHAKVIAVVNVGEFRGAVVGIVHARTLPPRDCGLLLYNSSVFEDVGVIQERSTGNRL
jgi:hypothetical protein